MAPITESPATDTRASVSHGPRGEVSRRSPAPAPPRDRPDRHRSWRRRLEILIVLGLLTLPFWVTDLDLRAARLFHDPTLPGSPWPGEHSRLVLALYAAAPLLGVAFAALGIGWIALGLARPERRLRAWQGLALLLILATGPGLVVNDVFKENMGRPRPRELADFGGRQTYLPPLQPGETLAGTSFPSGHAAAGFVWLGLYRILRRREVTRARWALGLGLAAGVLIGWVRVSMGGHFLSDVFWSAACIWVSAWLVCDVLLELPTREQTPDPVPLARTGRRLAAFAVAALVLLVVEPRHKEVRLELWTDASSPARRLRLHSVGADLVLHPVAPRSGAAAWIYGYVEGVTWAGGRLELAQTGGAGPGGELRVEVSARGLIGPAHGRVDLRLDPRAFDRIEVETDNGCVRLLSAPCATPPGAAREHCKAGSPELVLAGTAACGETG